MHIEDSLLVLLSFSTWRKEQEQPRNTSPRERMIPWEVDRVKAVLRWRNSILLSLSLSHAEKSGDAMVGSQGAPVRFCCRRRLCFMPPTDGVEEREREREREGERARERERERERARGEERRRRRRKRMIERFEDGERERKREREERMKGAKGMMTAEQNRADRKEGRAAEPKPTNERANNRRTTERPKRGKTMKSELQIRKYSQETKRRKEGRRATSREKARRHFESSRDNAAPSPRFAALRCVTRLYYPKSLRG